MTRALLVVLLVGALSITACAGKDSAPSPSTDESVLLGQDGADTATTESDAELLVSSLVSPAASGGLPSLSSFDPANLSTADFGDGAKAIFFPRGCLTTAHDTAAKTVTYTFATCAGPNGLLRITGEIKATYAAADGGGLALDIAGDGLTLNRATVDLHADAVITAPKPLKRAMTWKAQLSGTTARGRTFTRTNDKTVTWRVGERCFSFSGTSEGAVKGRILKTVVRAFLRCQAACPEAGGSIAITNVDSGKTVEIDFDGTSSARLKLASGVSEIVPLFCSE